MKITLSPNIFDNCRLLQFVPRLAGKILVRKHEFHHLRGAAETVILVLVWGLNYTLKSSKFSPAWWPTPLNLALGR